MQLYIKYPYLPSFGNVLYRSYQYRGVVERVSVEFINIVAFYSLYYSQIPRIAIIANLHYISLT